MNTHALSVLEFHRALDQVAGCASSELGANRVRTIVPSSSINWIEEQQRQVAAVRILILSDTGWEMPRIPSAANALERLRIEGASLTAQNLHSIAVLLRGSRLVKDSLSDSKYPAAALAMLRSYGEHLLRDPRSESEISRAIDEDGNVKDDASPDLRRIRRELRGAEGQLVAMLERLMSKLEPHQQVPDMSVTVRNGRYVIPVRREGRVSVGGIVHDSSGSGSTIFVEPPAAIEAGNRIRELESEELREIDRILSSLSDVVRPHYEALVLALDTLVELDTLYARARYGLKYNGNPVELCDPKDGFSIVNGRHPLLLIKGIPVVPFSLEMHPSERTLLVSGPNTGGKTVLLKATALLSLLVQCGVPVPASETSRIAVFDDFFADIGDEQSIEASLSTFSAHVKNLRDILNNATHRALVLIDELGSGTDPLEGAAIGGAVLEALTKRGTLTIATTHLGSLKELAIENKSIVNASLQFDPVALAPTYRLIKGIPGRSYGISIARRLEMPEAVLHRAEERLPTGERDSNALLADLEAREEKLSVLEAEAAQNAEDSRQRLKSVAERERKAGVKERELEREARKEARKYLLEAKKQVEETIKHLQEVTAIAKANLVNSFDNVAGRAGNVNRNNNGSIGASATDEIASLGSPDSNDLIVKQARKQIEQMVLLQKSALDRLDKSDSGAHPKKLSTGKAVQCVVGDRVEVSTIGGKVGQIIDIRDGKAVVAVGAMKLTVPLKQLNKVDYTPPPIAVQVFGDIPEADAKNEVDLRGMRVGDVDDLVMHALDNAIRADLKTLRIIHGKGTGALRERVNAMLRAERRVSSFRIGAWNEGGAGVTVVELS